MSALLDQFVDEAGDLLESAGSALLVLERNPSDASAVNDLFRSVHTLKGTSALFEFPAFTKLVHAGEDLLDCVREGSVAVSPELVDVQLEVLDLLRAWIDSVRDAGALPDDAANRSRELLARLTELKAAVAPDAAVAAEPGVAAAGGVTWEWLAALPEDDRVAAFRAADDGTTLVAIEYTPDPDCYFRGEDPLFTCRGLPDVLAFGITVVGSAIPLAEFDPYVCRMRFVAITSAPQREIDHLFRYVSEQVRVAEIAPADLAVPTGTPEVDAACAAFVQAGAAARESGGPAAVVACARELLPSVDPHRRSASALRWIIALGESDAIDAEALTRLVHAVAGVECEPAPAAGGSGRVPASDVVLRLLDEQRNILALTADDAEELAGRIASVGRVLANIAVAHGRGEIAARLQTATAAALAAGDAQLLAASFGECFDTAATTAAMPGRPGAGREGPRTDAGGDGHHIRMLKVDQAKVDRLMALIGELVVAKNALPFLARRAQNVHGSRELSREIGQRYSVIDRLAQEMQEAIMEVRLLPVSEVFARFPRLIRDVARKLDKQIDLVLEGEETQADKNIIELLGDPLIHIVRNAADHGIEAPQARTAAGKPATGKIRLRAMQEGDRVVIEVSDDGRGVDTARVIAKALERGIIDTDEAERMTPAEAANLIFHPGLSTADEISDLSGRGVGMDVVQTAIREAGGSVAVTSQPGLGTTVRLALPLSMAVMRVMTIETAGTLYGVPIDLIAETVRIDATAIREIKQSEAFLLRDTIVPLVRLRTLLRLPPWTEEREAVLVLRTAGGLVGVIVDRFDEHMDIILKPLEGILVGLRGFAGTALLGDGRVLMVLDVKELL
jgi:two-component system chemotaxis sensor kinase CheA